jgi:type VII secretion-associated serine protease mycosin
VTAGGVSAERTQAAAVGGLVPGSGRAREHHVPAVSSSAGSASGVERGPSTRISPRVLAAAVKPGQAIRVATVRLDGSRARVEVTAASGPVETERRIAAAQADQNVVAVQVDRRIQVDLADGPGPSGAGAQRVSAARPTSATPATAAAGTPVGNAALSDDPLRDEQWALDQLSAERVWTAARGSSQVVAVVDSGVDSTHPDLQGQVLAGTDFVTSTGDGSMDLYGHGTHVAGIIAARAGNGIGIAGLAPDVRILPVRVLDASGSGWDSDIAAGIIWAADEGARVVNLSLGGPDASDLMRLAVQYAVSGGAVVVASAGNERMDGNPVSYPAGFALPGELGVAATTEDRLSASFSNTGPYVTVSAPGEWIMSTFKGGYALKSGTSMAAPYASAAVALLRSVAPSLGPVDLVEALTSTATDLEGPGRDDATGYGLIDPEAALCDVGHCPQSSTPTPSSTTASTTASTTSGTSPSTSPSTSPPPAVTPPLRVAVRVLPATAVAGSPTTLHVTVTDAHGPVEAADLTVSGARRTARGRTGADGTARIAVAPPLTAYWSVTASAGGHTTSVRLKIPVAPKVVVRWAGSRVTVAVRPARRQLVTVVQGGAVRSKARLGTASGSQVTLYAPRTGRVRVTVGAGGGLVPVTAYRPVG